MRNLKQRADIGRYTRHHLPAPFTDLNAKLLDPVERLAKKHPNPGARRPAMVARTCRDRNARAGPNAHVPKRPGRLMEQLPHPRPHTFGHAPEPIGQDCRIYLFGGG